jgi:hypothetical protein
MKFKIPDDGSDRLHLPLSFDEEGDILDARGFIIAEGCTTLTQLRELVELANRPSIAVPTPGATR